MFKLDVGAFERDAILGIKDTAVLSDLLGGQHIVTRHHAHLHRSQRQRLLFRLTRPFNILTQHPST